MDTPIRDKNAESSDTHSSTMSYFIWETLKASKLYAVSCIPNSNIKALDGKNKRLFYFMFLAGIGIMLSVFLYFFIIAINAGQKNKFVSLSQTSGVCKTISRQLTANLYSDTSGNWQGFQTFSFMSAKYSFNFQGFDGNEFQPFIEKIYDVIHNIGAEAANSPLYKNLITWAVYTYFATSGEGEKISVSTFEFSGATSEILAKKIKVDGGMSSKTGLCSADTILRSESTVSLIWNVVPVEGKEGISYEFVRKDCNNLGINPEDYGYDPKYGFQFSMTIDLNAFMTAVGLNLNIIKATNLVQTNRRFRGLHSYFDPRYPGMNPLYCSYNILSDDDAYSFDDDAYSFDDGTDDNNFNVTDDPANETQSTFRHSRTKRTSRSFELLDSTNTTAPPYCYILLNEDLMCLPTLTPWDSNCLDCRQEDTFGYCNVFDMMPSCLFAYNDEDILKVAAMSQQELYNSTQRVAYDTVMAMPGDNATAENWNFCPHCYLFAVNFYDGNDEVNGYFTSVSNGHCSDSFSTTKAHWAKLITTPPLPLTETYYECVASFNTILSTSFGIAMSNANSIGKFILAIFVTLVLIFVSYTEITEIPDELSYNFKKAEKLADVNKQMKDKMREVSLHKL